MRSLAILTGAAVLLDTDCDCRDNDVGASVRGSRPGTVPGGLALGGA
ncbi:MAG TPA: hypothetical protein VFR71_00720 [Methyloceanibacter sp.]|nr:hypothetical protein [Methyloceanibacter sp.]